MTVTEVAALAGIKPRVLSYSHTLRRAPNTNGGLRYRRAEVVRWLLHRARRAGLDARQKPLTPAAWDFLRAEGVFARPQSERPVAEAVQA